MRALFLSSYPTTAAATRFRVAQYFPYLEREGIECTLSSFLSVNDFTELYSRRGAARKGIHLLMLGARRVAEMMRAGRYDVVFVQRDAMLYGPPLIEWSIAQIHKRPLIFDFDDAIWMHYRSPTWGAWAVKLKCPGKTAQIIRLARQVIAGNEYTRDYALRWKTSDEVTVIPTVVDAEQYRPLPRRSVHDQLVVGWIGTHSTAQYLEGIAGPLAECASRVPFRLKVVGAGRDVRMPGVMVENKAWKLDEEIADYQSLDIGLYPMPDNEWTRGKAGFKSIVYMSTGATCLSSPAGGVTEHLQHGVNGLIAADHSEWTASLMALLHDPALRARLAVAARETVTGRYSMHAQAPRLAAVIRSAA